MAALRHLNHDNIDIYTVRSENSNLIVPTTLSDECELFPFHSTLTWDVAKYIEAVDT